MHPNQFSLLLDGGDPSPYKINYRGFSGPASLLIHVTLILSLFLIGRSLPPKARPGLPDLHRVVDLSPYLASLRSGGGGGGDGSPVAASVGIPPRFTAVQLAPAEVVLRDLDPKLPVEATVLGLETKMPPVDLKLIGDPWGVVGPPSNGRGKGGGIGDGGPGGVGPGPGPGVGPCAGPDCGFATASRPFNGITAPELIYKVEPEYTDAARKARYQGTAMFQAVVGADGRVRELRIVRALGMGLDEKAMEAVRQWKFRPGTKNGQPLDVVASIEVTFRLL